MRRHALTRGSLSVIVLGLAAWALAGAIAGERDGRSSSRAAVEEQSGRVERVVDGDTLVVVVNGVDERVRLLGIDTPEPPRDGRPGEYLAVEASDLARSLALGRRVRLRGDALREDRDDYGRLLRYVLLPDERLLNAELVRSGHARVFTRYRFEREDEFLALEALARRQGIGLWAAAGLAEIDWNLAHGRRPVRLHPTTGWNWAIEYAGWVRTGLRAGELPRELGKLRGAAERGKRGDLAAWLREAGYVRLPGPAR